jgi:hypothetical protein
MPSKLEIELKQCGRECNHARFESAFYENSTYVCTRKQQVVRPEEIKDDGFPVWCPLPYK